MQHVDVVVDHDPLHLYTLEYKKLWLIVKQPNMTDPTSLFLA